MNFYVQGLWSFQGAPGRRGRRDGAERPHLRGLDFESDPNVPVGTKESLCVEHAQSVAADLPRFLGGSGGVAPRSTSRRKIE